MDYHFLRIRTSGYLSESRWMKKFTFAFVTALGASTRDVGTGGLSLGVKEFESALFGDLELKPESSQCANSECNMMMSKLIYILETAYFTSKPILLTQNIDSQK